jgi:hypothetical protein
MSSAIEARHINPWALPSVTLDRRQMLPRSPGVYFALARTEILYIGKSGKSIKNRWAAHHRLADLSCVREVRISWIEAWPTCDISKLERDLITLFSPVLNDGPVFNCPQNTESRPRVKGPRSWDTYTLETGVRVVFLTGMDISDLGVGWNWKHRNSIDGAWFPSDIVHLAIGPNLDMYDDECPRAMAKYKTEAEDQKTRFNEYINRAQSVSIVNNIALSEALNQMALTPTTQDEHREIVAGDVEP